MGIYLHTISKELEAALIDVLYTADLCFRITKKSENVILVQWKDTAVEITLLPDDDEPTGQSEDSSPAVYINPLRSRFANYGLAEWIGRMLEASESYLWQNSDWRAVFRMDESYDGSFWERLSPTFIEQFTLSARLSLLSRMCNSYASAPDYKGLLMYEGHKFDICSGPCLNVDKLNSPGYTSSEYIFIYVRDYGKEDAPATLKRLAQMLKEEHAELHELTARGLNGNL